MPVFKNANYMLKKTSRILVQEPCKVAMVENGEKLKSQYKLGP